MLYYQGLIAGICKNFDTSKLQIGMANATIDRIIYNNITGQLFCDINGNVEGGMTQFANKTAGTMLDIGAFVMT